jgi:SpoVK/Ycf46/Vps4 family AAA+-type ATPase
MAETRAAQAVISAAEADARAEAADWSATLDKKNLVEAEARATAANVRATAAETRVTAVETCAADADARAEAAEKKLEEYTKRATEVVTKLAEANKTIAVYKKRATEVETKHAEVDQQQSNDSNRASRGTAQDEANADKEQLRSQIRATILNNVENVKWADVAGLEVAKEILEETIFDPIRHPEAFVGKRKPFKGILLYGPPGTGEQLSSVLRLICRVSFCS